MADIEKQKKSIIEKLEEASQSIEKVAFVDQDISNIKLVKLNLNGHLFRKCNFYVSKFISCTFEKCEFLNCNFSNTDLLNVKFIDCTFVNCDFTEATLQDVLVEGGFKSNNIFNKLNIKENVTGIEQSESNLISDQKETVNESTNTNNTDKVIIESVLTSQQILELKNKIVKEVTNSFKYQMDRIEKRLDRLENRK